MATGLAGKMYDILLDELLSNRLTPGQMINRRQIASTYGMSVAPVLEAMLQLEHEGFLETIPRKGTQVKVITIEDIYGSFLIRDAIESKAARLYYAEALTSSLDQLTSLAQEVDSAPDDHLEDWKTEIRFHRRLVALSGCQALSDALDRVMRLNVFYGMNQFIPVQYRTPRDNHTLLLEKLSQARSADDAERIIRTHVWFGKEYLLDRPV